MAQRAGIAGRFELHSGTNTLRSAVRGRQLHSNNEISLGKETLTSKVRTEKERESTAGRHRESATLREIGERGV
jgi:hypothetical protein